MNVPRRKYREGFGPAQLHETIEVPIADDNLVCGHCGAVLGLVEWTVVSSPKRKGIVVFACKEHISQAMNLLGTLLTIKPVPDELKLPDEKNN